MKYILHLIVLISVALIAIAQEKQGYIHLTPIRDGNLIRQKLIVPAQFKGIISDNLYLNVPEGYKVKVFYAGSLNKTRFLTWGPDSVLYAADMSNNRIIALPDKDGNLEADELKVAASNISANNLQFYNGAMYAAETDRVWKLTDKNQDGLYDTKTLFIDSVGGGTTGGHSTRTVLFNPATKKMYLSIGSSCNVCGSEKIVSDIEPRRAIIEEYNDDGTGRRVFAEGCRNSVGLTLNPVTGQLWADNNGSDLQGNDIPPEWVDVVRDGGFYGYPIAHSYQMYFPNYNVNSDYSSLLPINSFDSAMVRTMIQPAALVQAHSAPMQLEFSNNSFPDEYSNGLFVVFRGSWNRSPATGYKIVFLGFNSLYDTTAEYVTDFMTGFLTDSVRGSNWGRPVGLALDHRGNLFFTSDATTNFIGVVYKDNTTGINENNNYDSPEIKISPNPLNGSGELSFRLNESGEAKLTITDLLGRTIAVLLEQIMDAGEHNIEINSERNYFPAGIYFCTLSSGGREVTSMLQVTK